MNCRHNKKTIKLSYTVREYCDKCFLNYVEHRVRKDIRINKKIKPRSDLTLFDDESNEFLLAKHFLENVFGKNLEVKTSKNKAKANYIPTNLDKYISGRVPEFMENTNKDETNYILDNVLEEEIKELCRILKLKGKEIKTELNPLIEEMEKKYPGTKFSIHRSFMQLDASE